jgi:arylsulfatase A-like enzyme
MKQLLAILVCFGYCPALLADAEPAPRPNVLLIIADDMGYGDLGWHGNPKLHTPQLDRLAAQSVRLKNFYVSPVCSPTRASLLTGRWNYRTGVVDTYIGRSLMHADETTLAEQLGAVGYRCGIFGKWHLGDNYPLRAIDQGFHEALVHNGGGIGQPSDPPGNSYFDPVLFHNGQAIKTKGYCSDVFTDAAIKFVSNSPPYQGGARGVAPVAQPFFAYLAYNCPHDPLQAPEDLHRAYRRLRLNAGAFPQFGQPLPDRLNEDNIAKVYAMVENLDTNVGRLLAMLDELKLAENTIVIFLTDNGPAFPRYNAGLRDRKGSVFDGGIRVPCFVRWPTKLSAGRKIDTIAAHVDITPTLLEACGVPSPSPPAGERVGVRGAPAFDGKSLLPLLKGDKIDWPARSLFFQWHRGDTPELGRCFAVREQQWKLVQPLGRDGGKLPDQPPLHLFDMSRDPYEQHDVSAEHPDIVARLRTSYEVWFKDVSGTRGFAQPRIHLGSPQENPTTLTRQDWRGPRAGWRPGDLGHWEVFVARAGTYSITLRFPPAEQPATAHFQLGDTRLSRPIEAKAASCVFSEVQLPPGDGRLEAWLERGQEKGGVHYVVVERSR